MAGRYAHAKQFKRMNRQIKFLRTRLGRIIRDIGRKTEGDEGLEEAFAVALGRASQIRGQKQRQRGWKLSPAAYAAPLARRSASDMARARDRVLTPWARRERLTSSASRSRSPPPIAVPRAASSSSTPRPCPVIPQPALGLDPRDGHTLADVLEETEALTGREIERAYVDKGYRGHEAPKSGRVFKSGQKRGVHGQIKRELRRRSAIEAVIGHCKTDGHLGRNFLKGRLGDHINAVMSAVGYNLRLILKWLRKLLTKIIAAIGAAITPRSALKPAS